MRPGELFLQMVQEPALGCMVLTLGTGTVAAGMVDTVLSATGLALVEAMTVMAAVALLDGGHGLLVRQGQMGEALQVLWRKRVKDILDGGHERSPCIRESMR